MIYKKPVLLCISLRVHESIMAASSAAVETEDISLSGTYDGEWE